MERWTITYQTPESGRVTCIDLLHEGVERIARVQHALGATEIESFSSYHRPGDRVEVWGEDVNGRVCIVAKARRNEPSRGEIGWS